MHMHELADDLRLQLLIPTPAPTGPGGPFRDFAGAAPISRIPAGYLAATTHPACLDYVMASTRTPPQLQWRDAPGDHAWLSKTIALNHKIRTKWSTWQFLPTSEDTIFEVLAAVSPHSIGDAEALQELLADTVALTQHEAPAGKRRAQREPASIKTTRQELLTAREEKDRQRVLLRLVAERKTWLRALAIGRNEAKAKRGQTPAKAQNTHKLSEVVVDGVSMFAPDEWSGPIATTNNQRWGLAPHADKVLLQLRSPACAATGIRVMLR